MRYVKPSGATSADRESCGFDHLHEAPHIYVSQTCPVEPDCELFYERSLNLKIYRLFGILILSAALLLSACGGTPAAESPTAAPAATAAVAPTAAPAQPTAVPPTPSF